MSHPVPVFDPSAGESYPAVNADAIASVEIFPPLGISRFGDSTTEYFFGPEIPGQIDPPTPDKNFRDSSFKIRRQAARFRAYAYDGNGICLGELNNRNGFQLAWTVHVANKKPAHTLFRGRLRDPTEARRNPDVDPTVPLDERTKLIINSGERSITTGKAPVELSGVFYGSRPDPTKVYLGELHVDGTGRLVFLGGRGASQSIAKSLGPHPEIISEFDSTDWFDDACDGWVSLKVTSNSGFAKEAAHKAHVLSAPPKFAWGIRQPTNIFDIMEDIYPHKPEPVEFYRDIWPILFATYGLSWVNDIALEGHGPFGKGDFQGIEGVLASNSPTNKGLRTRIFDRLRKPDYKDADQASVKYMPRLSGDNGDAIEPGITATRITEPIKNFSALTALQYERFAKWRDGDFTAQRADPVKNIEHVKVDEQPKTLTRAILEQTIGDPLYPGIEAYWVMKLRETYDLGVTALDPPFRFNATVLPGHLTSGLSLPWQCDFYECNTHWWPSVRPDSVVTKADYDAAMQQSGSDDQKLAVAATTRKAWDRGLRPSGDDYISFPGSTDMVLFWKYLGFIKKWISPQSPKTLAFVESERRKLPEPTGTF